jgi:hypothetical protein
MGIRYPRKWDKNADSKAGYGEATSIAYIAYQTPGSHYGCLKSRSKSRVIRAQSGMARGTG